VKGQGLRTGRPDLALAYDGHEYRFADASARTAFLESPELFLPRNNGRCPVALVDGNRPVTGDPRAGVYYRSRLFLCADEEARRRFASDPERYVSAVKETSEEQRAEAFRASPKKYVR
jgi:YHS domain-containing protein